MVDDRIVVLPPSLAAYLAVHEHLPSCVSQDADELSLLGHPALLVYHEHHSPHELRGGLQVLVHFDFELGVATLPFELGCGDVD